MKNNIRLFIGDMEVDFKTTPDIFYNFTEEDLTNPTVVNNSFSKTITIESTPNNDKIFGHFWNLDRYQLYDGNTGTSFNPSKKTPFKLYVNGELYESGYVKLDEVRRNGKAIEYDVTLYGGLGEFFFDISYDDEGNQLSLADLTYMDNGDANEFDFSLTKETLNEAWFVIHPDASRSHKWHFINFAPCYNGYPDNFDANKAMVNFSGNTLDHSEMVDGLLYRDRDGWSLGTLPDKLDEWAIRDLRSWCQRPVVRFSGIVEAIAKYAAQKGYSLDLDGTFFNYDNPYYEAAWITLPMPSEINIQGASETPAATATTTIYHTFTYNGAFNTLYAYNFNPSMPVGTTRVNFDLKFRVHMTTYSSQWYNTPPDVLYTSTYATSPQTASHRRYTAYAIQFLCYDGDNPNTANIIGGSPAVFLTSKVGDDYLKTNEIKDGNGNISSYWLKWGSEYNYSFGQFNSVGNYYYDWSETIPLSFDVPNNTQAFGIYITAVAPTSSDRMNTYSATTCDLPYNSGSTVVTARIEYGTGYTIANSVASGYTSNGTAGFSGANLNKKLLLTGEHTPADYLLSYCKLFGLHFYKKPNDKVIHIMQRGTFFDTGTTISLNDKIDYNSEIRVSPLSFDSKWYDMELESVGGDFESKYENTYGRTYGIQKINTGFDFNADAKNIFDDNIFMSAVEGVGKNKYYLAPVTYDGSQNIPYVTFQGMSYLLYHQTGLIQRTTTIQLSNLVNVVPPVALGYDKYYDAYSKAQFCDGDMKRVDGRDVLLFFKGFSEEQPNPYFVTDDLPVMGTFNSNTPCWIYTNNEYASGGTRIAYASKSLPVFGRFIENPESHYHTFTWDFGQVKQLFVPEAVSISGGTIYGRFWGNYINDLYDVNTRVMSCKVRKDGFKPSPELFRPFYAFENALWRLNSISDWNAGTDDLGTAEFVKVNDISSYNSKTVTTDPELSFTVERNVIPQEGATIGGAVLISDGGSWVFEFVPGGVEVSPDSSVGDKEVSITFPANTGATREVVIGVRTSDGDQSASQIFTLLGAS